MSTSVVKYKFLFQPCIAKRYNSLQHSLKTSGSLSLLLFSSGECSDRIRQVLNGVGEGVNVGCKSNFLVKFVGSRLTQFMTMF